MTYKYQATLLLFLVLRAATSSAETIQGCLDRFASLQKSLQNYRMQGETIENWSSSLDRSDHITRLASEVDVDGDRLNVTARFWDVHSVSERPSESQAVLLQSIWDGTTYYFYNSSEARKYSNIVLSSPQLAPKDASLRAKRTLAKSDGAVLLGFLMGDQINVVDVLQDAERLKKCTITAEILDGITRDVIEADTPYGIYRVWFDAKRSGNIVKAKVLKRPADDYYGSSLSAPAATDARTIAAMRQRGLPPGQRRSFRMELEGVELKEQQGLWIPMKGTWKTITEYSDGADLTETFRFERTLFEVAPNFEDLGCFRPSFAEGSVVRVEQHDDVIPLKWHAGKVVPDVDSVGLQDVDKQIAMLGADLGRSIAVVKEEPKERPGPLLDPGLLGPVELGSSTAPKLPMSRYAKAAGVLVVVLLLCAAIVGIRIFRKRAA